MISTIFSITPASSIALDAGNWNIVSTTPAHTNAEPITNSTSVSTFFLFNCFIIIQAILNATLVQRSVLAMLLLKAELLPCSIEDV